MAADIFTKPFTDPQKWKHAITNIGLFRPGEAVKLPPRKAPTGKDQREIGLSKDGSDNRTCKGEFSAKAKPKPKQKSKAKAKAKQRAKAKTSPTKVTTSQ